MHFASWLLSVNTLPGIIWLQTKSWAFRFNGHFPGEPGLAGVYWSKGWWRWWWQLDYWNRKSSKAPVKSSPPTNQHPVFTGRMPFLSPNQQCPSIERKSYHHHHYFVQPAYFQRSFQFKPSPTKEKPLGVAVLDFYRLGAFLSPNEHQRTEG